MNPWKPAVAGFVALSAVPAFANEAVPLDYAAFAETTPHVTLMECPTTLAVSNAACHVATIDGVLYLLAFDRSGKQQLLAVRSEAGHHDGVNDLCARIDLACRSSI